MPETEGNDDELLLEDPWLLAELEKESVSMPSSQSTSNGSSNTVMSLRLKGEEWCKVVSNSCNTEENISNPIDINALAQTVTGAVVKVISDKLSKKASALSEKHINSSFDIEKFMYGLPDDVSPRLYFNDEILLGCENYWQWMRMITEDLERKNLHLWTNSRFAEATGLPQDVRMRYDNYVQQILYASISPKLHTFLVEFESAWEIFIRLRERFGSQKTGDLLDLFHRLESVEIKVGQSMDQFFETFATLREEFRQRLPDLNDLFFCAKLLLKLKPLYPQIVAVLSKAPRHLLTYHLIREQTLMVEQARCHCHKASSPITNYRFRSLRSDRRKQSDYISSGKCKRQNAVYANFCCNHCKRNFTSPVTSRHGNLPTQACNRRHFSTYRAEKYSHVPSFREKCYNCGKRGHRTAMCWNYVREFGDRYRWRQTF